jgi:hypothetical protein
MKPIGWITCDLCGKSQEELEETQYGWMCLDCYVKKLRADLARVTGERDEARARLAQIITAWDIGWFHSTGELKAAIDAAREAVNNE